MQLGERTKPSLLMGRLLWGIELMMVILAGAVSPAIACVQSIGSEVLVDTNESQAPLAPRSFVQMNATRAQPVDWGEPPSEAEFLTEAAGVLSESALGWAERRWDEFQASHDRLVRLLVPEIEQLSRDAATTASVESMDQRSQRVRALNAKVEHALRALAALECEFWSELAERAEPVDAVNRERVETLVLRSKASAWTRHSRAYTAILRGDLRAKDVLSEAGVSEESCPGLRAQLAAAEWQWAQIQLERCFADRDVGVELTAALGRVKEGAPWDEYVSASRAAATRVVSLCKRQAESQRAVLDWVTRCTTPETSGTIHFLLLVASHPELAETARARAFDSTVSNAITTRLGAGGCVLDTERVRSLAAAQAQFREEFAQLSRAQATALDTRYELEARGLDPDDPAREQERRHAIERAKDFAARWTAVLVALGVLDVDGGVQTGTAEDSARNEQGDQ